MRGFFGVVLVVAGVVLVYLFGAISLAAAKAVPVAVSGSVFSLPLQVLGANYPKDALCLAGGLAALGWGLYLLFQGGATPAAASLGAGSRLSSRLGEVEILTGSYTRAFCLLALGACLALAIAAVGAAARAPAAVIGGFVAVAAIAFLEALVLGILTFFEPNKPVIVLLLGWILFVAALGFGIAGIVLGAAAG